MKKHIFITALLGLLCSCGAPGDKHSHEEDSHSSVQVTATQGNIELYAECEHLEEGEECHLEAWFTDLDSFKAAEVESPVLLYKAEEGQIIRSDGERLSEGFYHFDFTPCSDEPCFISIEAGELSFDISAASHVHAPANSVKLPLEQIWKITFSSSEVQTTRLGSVIKASARLGSLPGAEKTIIAKASGIVSYAFPTLTVGSLVKSGQELMRITSKGLTEDNLEVRYSLAEAEFQRAEQEYERLETLSEKNIVSKAELNAARASYLSAKAEYENLKENIRNGLFCVSGDMNGYIDEIYVSNGEYVTTGTPLVCIAQRGPFLATAKVSSSYYESLGNISDVIFLTPKGEYSLEEIGGKVVSISQSTSEQSPLISVNMQIEGYEGCVSGSFADVRICTESREEKMAVPNEALVEESGNFFVYKQLSPVLFEKVQVVRGESNGRLTVIESGLQGDETIVGSGAVILKLAQVAGSLDAHSGHVH